MAHGTRYELVVTFPDQNPSFVHGFEAGRLWEELNRRPKTHTTLLHAANQIVVDRLARAQGYTLHVEETEQEEWLRAVLTRLV